MEREDFRHHYLFNLERYSEFRGDVDFMNCLVFMRKEFPNDSIEQIFEKSLGCLVTNEMIFKEIVPKVVADILRPNPN